jgi:hypothetical protein
VIALAYALKILAAVMAAGVARVRREYAPVAVALIVSTAADLLRLVLSPWLAYSRAVISGSSSITLIAVRDLDTALWLTWPAGLAASAVVVFLRRKPWGVAIVWATLSIALAAVYPWSRGEHLRQTYLAAELAAQAIALGGAIVWTARRDPPHVEHAALALLLATELGTLIAGPWRAIFTTWRIAQLMYVGAFAALVVVQGGALWKSRPL